MARDVQRSYQVSAEHLYAAVTTAIAELGYSVKNSDPQSGVVSFNTGMSIWSWSGQDITVTVIRGSSGSRVALAGGLAKRGLSKVQVVGWGEKDRVVKRFLDTLDQTVAATPEPTASENLGNASDDTEELERLAKLHASGALTDEEFAAAKAKILE